MIMQPLVLCIVQLQGAHSHCALQIHKLQWVETSVALMEPLFNQQVIDGPKTLVKYILPVD